VFSRKDDHELRYLHTIRKAPHRLTIGNKADGLKKLMQLRFSVPDSWVVPASVFTHDAAAPVQDEPAFLKELTDRLDTSQRFAVRSSGNLEDSVHHSFAGQFETVLNVTGSTNLLEAVKQVRASADRGSKETYLPSGAGDDALNGMAVIIQQMIDAAWSGVAFSINPVTGRPETVIEGIEGGGAALVQEGRTPERWISHQDTWEGYDETQAPPREVLEEIVSGMHRLQKAFKNEVDVEWAWDGQKLWYLQCRAVTTGEFPTIYSNHISREVLPGMIKPLVWSINIPVVNSGWIRLLSEMLGKLDIAPEQLSHPFYYRAYFNMGTLGTLFRRMGFPKDSLESLMGRRNPSGKSSFKPSLRTMKYLPGMLAFLVKNLRLGKKFRRKFVFLEQETTRLKKRLEAFEIREYQQLFTELHTHATEAAYWNIIIPLSMQITNRMLHRKMDKKGRSFHAMDFSGDFPELRDHDPQIVLRELQLQWLELPDDIRSSIKNFHDLETKRTDQHLAGIVSGIGELIDRFGHFSESGNDFSYTPWREDPDFLFDLVRREPPEKEEGQKAGQKHLDTGASIASEKVPRNAYHRAGKYRVYREMISSEYTRCYGLFRELFLGTGHYFASHGLLEAPEDVFYLTLEEHDRLVEDPAAANTLQIRDRVQEVKEEMKRYEDITLPAVIYGEVPPPIAAPENTTLKGIPTSPGVFEGEVVVVKGYNDFNKPVEGKVLVIPFSDVGWTPLLVKAGAIVSESGGMLSHASIIARELKIPAISSVDHALNLQDGSHAMVDGYNGQLTIQ
jgi:pyruvate,water dikinase